MRKTAMSGEAFIQGIFSRMPKRRMADVVKQRQGFDEVFYPGEVEDRAEAANLAAGGVILAEQSLVDLRALAAEAGVPFPAEVPR